jgi:methionyl aminopeptidase
VPYSRSAEEIVIHDEASIDKMRNAARLARRTLDLACSLAVPGITTDDIDRAVHEAIISENAYPSPLNYAGFPKSLCSSINEIICHGIPDTRPLQFGDVVSFDVSCYLDGVHGDNCATCVVGDQQETNEGAGEDWRGVPYLTKFENEQEEAHFVGARRLVSATLESLMHGIETCKPGSFLSEIGAAIEDVATAYGYSSVRKYRGHGIGHEFHTAPFVKHYRHDDDPPILLVPGMIFTIEPMLTQGSPECFEWEHDHWTVSTLDGGLAAQFEHTVLITHSGVEILTVPE